MLSLVLQEGLLPVLSPQVTLTAVRPNFPSKFRGKSPLEPDFIPLEATPLGLAAEPVPVDQSTQRGRIPRT